MKYISLLAVVLVCNLNTYAQIFTATPNQSLPEGSNTTFNIATTGLPFNSNTNFGFYEVCITINHPLASDLRLQLESPSGTYLQLHYNNGGSANFANACFRLYASKSIRYSNAPFNGAYMAYDNMLDLLDNQDPNGVWKLHIQDNIVNGITGTLTSWQLNFIANPNTVAINNSSTNLPIFKLDIPLGYIPDDPKTPGVLKIIDNISGVNNFNSTLFTSQHQLAIERQGYTSAWGDKPNYDFEFQNLLGDDTAIALLNLPAESDWILKSCVTDEYMMKDPLTFEMSRRMGYYAPRTKYVELMINGDYVGVYILEEKLKRDSNRIDISKLNPNDTAGVELTGGYIFEINPNGDPAAWYSNYLGYQGPLLVSNYEYKVVYPKQNTLHPKQLNYIHSYVDSFEDALHGVNYQDPNIGWRKYASEKDLIDFLIVSEYSTNYDTYGRSTYLYKEKSTDGNKIHCGPPWDSDRGYCCDTGWVHIITHGYWIFPFWWQQLRTDSVFNKTLACRFANLRSDVLTNNAFTNFIDSNQLLIQNAVQRNVNRWQNYIENTNQLKTIITNRLNWMEANLGGSVFPPLPLTTTTYCAGDPVNIFIGNQYGYNFKPGPDTSYFVPTVAGTYNAIVSTKYGCETKQAITITPHPQPIIVGNQYPCRNTSELYKVTHIPGTTYAWTINGGTLTSGGGVNDSTCAVFWGNPTFCMVGVKQSLTVTCSDTDIHPITIQNCTGTQDIDDSKYLSVYPSPVTKLLSIQTDKEIIEINVYDAAGKLVLVQKRKSEIDVSSLASGAYLLTVRDKDKRVYNTRFIKEE
ncbi:MAG TPA: CotH kinase family protein [Chitinophagaceae bacterium]|jgi:subtilisin-like proprotein convertase family protein|nr:CotH kinase family protein [Chitinophagaceae bacterium]